MGVNLFDLKVGDKVKVLGFNPGNVSYLQRLLSMGLVPNAEFTIIRIAPLGDPVELRIHHSYFCVRKKESAILQLERIEQH